MLPAAAARPFQQPVPLVPDPDVQLSPPVQGTRLLEAEPEGECPAVGAPAERWGTVVDRASPLPEVDAPSVRGVREHQGSRQVRVRLGPVLPGPVPGQKAHGVPLAAERAAITWNLAAWKAVCHGRCAPESALKECTKVGRRRTRCKDSRPGHSRAGKPEPARKPGAFYYRRVVLKVS